MNGHKMWVALAAGSSVLFGLTVGVAPSAQASSGLSSLLLTAANVPEFRPVSSAVETLSDPHDQGPDQAFISCAKRLGDRLLSQFDAGGPGSVTGPFWGEGLDSQFGAPQYSLASAAFSDGSAADAQAAEMTIARPRFQRCWASTTDTLNTQQGITVPIYPSTVQALPNPHIAASSTAFAVNSTYNALGAPVQFQMMVMVEQEQTNVVMLVGLTFNGQFPLSTITTASRGR